MIGRSTPQGRNKVRTHWDLANQALDELWDALLRAAGVSEEREVRMTAPTPTEGTEPTIRRIAAEVARHKASIDRLERELNRLDRT